MNGDLHPPEKWYNGAKKQGRGNETMGKCLGVFDSGFGGLTVLKELLKTNQYDRYVYFGDTARVPYGTRDADTIRAFALQDMRFLLSQGVDELVVACNTITAVALNALRAAAGVPVHGVIDVAAEGAVRRTGNRCVGLIATQATIDNGAYARTIRALDPAVALTEAACPDFVTLVEAGAAASDPAVIAACERYLAPIRAAGCDTVILGCTHFPVLQDAIAAYLGPDIALVANGAELAARMTGERCPHAPKVEFFVSGPVAPFDAQRRVFLPQPYDGPARPIDITQY